MSVQSTYYDEGFNARNDGKARSENPYQMDTAEWVHWFCGWNDADLITLPEGAL